MHYDLSRTERHHQTSLTETPSVSLIAKRCPCGKAAFARQLTQHGKCVACQLADRIATLHDGDLDILHFMVGATPHHAQSKWGFRNHYLANRQDLVALDRLIAAGFATAGASLLKLRYFHATIAGCGVAGLTGARIARAMAVWP